MNNEIPNNVPDRLAYLSPRNPEKNVVAILVILPANVTLPYAVDVKLSDCLILGSNVTYKAET